MRKMSRNHYFLVAVLFSLFTFLVIAGCGDGGSSAVPGDGGTQTGVAEKQMIIEGPIPNEIAENTAIPVPDAPSGIDRAAEFGDSKEFTIAVIDRDDPAMAKELAPVVIEASDDAQYRYKFKTTINIENGKKTPFIAIKSKILNKVVLSNIPGQIPAYSEIPKDVKKLYVKGVLINSESTARAVLANDNKMEISVPVITLGGNEQSQEVVVRVLSAKEKTLSDLVIENKVGGADVIREMSKAVDAIKTVLVTTELSAAEKHSIFENTREKSVVPSASGVISDYVLTLKNGKVQQKASELSINTSIEIAGTKIDGRTSVAVVDGSAKNAGVNADDAPPSLTSVTITPRTLNVGDELQLAFTTSKLLIFPPKVVIYDREVTVTKIDGTTYVANTTVSDSDPKDVTFKIDNLVGENGRTAPPVTDLTDGKKPVINDGITSIYPPVFDPPTGVYKISKVVTMASRTPGADIYYTTDGSEPSASSGTIFSSPVIVSADTTIKAVAVKDAVSSIVNQSVYVVKAPVVKAEAPMFSFSGGSYSKARSVEMKTSTEGAIIKYTTDGTRPSATNGVLYSSALSVDRQMVLKAVAIKEGMEDSFVTSAVYDVNIISETAPAAVFNPAPGKFISRQTVAIVSSLNGATIKYTLDGTVPSFTNGMVYTAPIVIMEPVTLKAVVINDGMQDSAVVSGFYDVNIVGPVLENAAPPIFYPQGGKYANYNRFQVKIISQAKGAKIIYTTDGTTPSASNGEVYSEPITLTQSANIKAVAIKENMLDSEVVSEFYEIKNDNAPPAPPVILGIKDGAITAKDVSLSWNEQEGVTSKARLLKNNQNSEYSKNTILSEEGSYTLEVGVTKTANNTSNKASLSFVIDKSLPAVPAILGIATGEVSARPVTLFWQDELWTKSTAKLVKKNGLKSDYVSGYEITEDGEYTLELLSTNERNGVTAFSSISFAVNSALPDVPYITGVYNDDIVSEDVALEWKDIDGATLTAKLSKNGGEPVEYIKKTLISESGFYKLTLYAKNNASGALNSRSIEFEIDKAAPDAPVISGVADGAVTSSEVRISWEDIVNQSGAAGLSKTGDLKKTTITAEISKDSGRFEPYVKNTLINSNGNYVVSLTAAKKNGRKKSSKISFVIDKNAPDAPVISIYDNGKGMTSISWEEQDQIEYFATLSRDGGESASYTRETPVSEKGIYTVAVTARRKDTKTEIVSKASFNRTSTGLVLGPKSPQVTGIENGAVTGSDVSISWKEIEGAIVSAKLKRNGGEFLEYKKGAIINEEGSFIVEAEALDPATSLSAKSTVSFTIDKKAPYAPVIAGVNDGAVTAAEAKISWNEQNGCETTAKLTKTGQLNKSNSENQYFPGYPGMYPGMGMYPGDYHDQFYYQYYFYRFYNLRGNINTNETQRQETAYEKNSSVSEDGEYELEVTAKKLLNGLSASSKIKFTVDTKAPDAPYIMGIENGTVTADDVKLYWQKSEGVKYSAKLVKDGTMTLAYENGSPITVEGSYYLEVVATREANGKTTSVSKKFKIDRSAPPVPAIKGVSEGDSISKDVEISWDDVEAMSIAAKISRDGAAALEYKKGAKLVEEGAYAFELSVTNPVTKTSNKKTIYFTIDKKKPDAPVISGITDGGVYGYAVSASWQVKSGVVYKAFIVKESGALNDYLSASPVSVDGDYRIAVTAIKANGLTSESAVKFTIDKKSPASPVIELKNGASGSPLAQAPSYGGLKKQPINGPTLVGWNEQEGCVTSATISKNGGEAVSYQKESPITVEGKYFVEVTAVKTKNGAQSKSSIRFSRMPDGFDAGPSAPKFNGVIAGSLNSKETAVSWQEEPGVSYYARLTKNGGNTIEFVNGSKISNDGSYDIEVTARKESNGLTNRAAISFKIDTSLPAVPVIEGISPEGVSASALSLSWKETAGVYYSASIKKNDEVITSYGNGFPITENGRYALEVTATKLSNGLKSTTALNFTIDKNPPEEPVILGVETGTTTPKPFSIEWKTQEGVKTSAILYRDGRGQRLAANGATLLEDGSYKIEVTAYKVSNGLTSKSSKSFIINKSIPEAPRVSGVENLKVYNSTVKPLWEEPSGVFVRAKLSKDGASAVDFIKGSTVDENGRYKLSVTAYGANGLLNETVLSFVVDRSAPEAPAISIVSKDGATMATWIENQGFSYSAKISKTGGIAEEYKNGNSITEDGSYTLELTVVKVSNGLSVKSSVNFTRTGVKIEKGPAAPQVGGVENGKYYNAAVTPFWKEIDGAKISAILTKFGNQPSAIVYSTKITDDGSYILEVTAANSSNNMSSKTTAAFIIDTTRPSAVLKYSANPAAEGVMRITAFYSETLAKGNVPKISINQPGSADVTGAAMTQDPSNPAGWYYDYTVKAADSSAYIDGVAAVKLSDVSDPAGNVSQAAQNDSFVINTSAPAAAINYSFVPAVSQNKAQSAPDRSPAASKANVFRAGKLTVIVSFANDIKTGQTPKIFIDQPGYGDVKDQPMAIGLSRRVWTYEYLIKPEDGQAYIDGQASVSISNAMDESGRLFLQPASRTFTIDTREPSVELSYSSNPAPAGKLTITAKYSELLQDGCAPYISIFQQGAYEIVDAVMTRGGASDVWTYEYTVKSSDLKEFKDGKAVVLLSPVTDAAGNISKRPYNSTFLIGTAVANYAVLTFGSNPARAGKMVVTAVFKDDYPGANGPRISIDQPGKADVVQKFMTQGAGRKIWTYDYVINDDNGVDFIDGIATVSLLDDMGGKIEITGGNTFSIDTTPPAVSLLSLNDGGEKLVGGSTYTLKWSASDSGGLDPAPITIAFYNGLNWTTVETGLANSGTYDWKVPSVVLSTAKVSVSAVDKVGNRSTSPSRNPFNIISSGPSWILGYPKAEASSSSSFKVTAKSDRSGKLYYMVFPWEARIAWVSAPELKYGNFHGAVQLASGALDITASAELSFEVKGMNASSAYDIFMILEDTNLVMQKNSQAISVTTLSKGIAFSPGYPAASQSGERYSMRINIRVKTGEAGKVYISGFNLYSFETVPAPPTSTEVKNGRWSNYRARPSVMKIDMTAGTEMTQSIDMMMVDPMMMMYMDMPGMGSQSNYILYAVAEDANGNLMDKPVKINWKSPTLKVSIPNDSNNLTKNSMSVKISSDSSGKSYYIVSKNPSAPSMEQLKNGVDASGSPVANGFKGELDLEANSEKTIAVSGLSESTRYYFFAAIEVADNMVSSVVSSNQITRGLEPIMLPGHPYSIDNWNAKSRWGVSLNSPGTVYAVAVPRGSKAPSAEQIKKGLNAEGKAAPDKGAIKPPEFSTDYWSADQHILFTQLTRWAEYDMYYVMADVNGKLYNVGKMEFMAR